MPDASDHSPLLIQRAHVVAGYADTFNRQACGMNATQSPPHPSEPLIWKATSAIPQTAKPSRPIRAPKRPWNRTWNWETIASFASILSLAALIALLASQNGKPLSAWTLPVSLNTAASILAVAIKSPLAFVVGTALSQTKWIWFSKRQGPLSSFVAMEEAGRGPLGSLSLLWELKLRHWASFGALITLGLLVVDPFIQGVITYDGENRTLLDSNAFILRTSTLDVGNSPVSLPMQGFYDGVRLGNCMPLYPDLNMIATTQVGFSNMSAIKDSNTAATVCPTGNCTWPPYSTLGICNSCENISDHLNKSTELEVERACRGGTLGNTTQYYLDYGFNRSKLVFRGDNGLFVKDCWPTKSKLAIAFRPQDTFSFRKANTLMAAFALIYAPEEYWGGKVAWEGAEIQATECALSYCVKTYNPIMINGKLDPREILTIYERATESWKPSFVEDGGLSVNQTIIDHLQDDVDKSLAPLHALGSTPGCEFVERSDLFLDIIPTAGLPDTGESRFTITQKTIQSTMCGLNQGVVELINNMLTDATNKTAAFDNAARLLTYRIGEIGDSKVSGTAEQWVTYVTVRWAFLAAPVAMVLGGGVLFAANVVIESEMLRLPILKGDPLNAFVFGLDDKSRSQIRAQDMDEETLKQATMGLRKTKGRIELRLVS